MQSTNAMDVSVASSGTQSIEVDDGRSGSLSSTPKWKNDLRLDVTRAVSECSIRDGDDDDEDEDDAEGRASHDSSCSWCAAALKLEMGVVEEGRSPSAVHQELVSHKSHHQRVSVNGNDGVPGALCTSITHSTPAEEEIKGNYLTSSLQSQLKETVPYFCETVVESSFAREARGQLQDLHEKNACTVPQDDGTLAVQDRLQRLLLSTVLEHEHPVCSGKMFEDAWETRDRCRTAIAGEDAFGMDVKEGRRFAIHSGAHGRELPLEHEEMKVDLSSQRRQFCFCCQRYTRQTVAEEMYCKETIQKIMQQVQGEIEQWSHMQDIAHTLQEELEAWSRWQKLWEDRALQAEAQLKGLQAEAHEWKCRAQSSNEELVTLRCEKKVLQGKIDMMEDARCKTSGTLQEADERPRCASVGAQHEEFASCESFVHSRNESGRSSVDLGASTQKSFRKAIMKSLDFATGKTMSNPGKFSFGSSGLIKAEINGMEFSSKKNAALNGRPKPYPTKVNSSESTHGHGYKGRKKARLFVSKENKNARVGAGGHVMNTEHGPVDCKFSSKPKASWPSAPASTPCRTPLGDIANLK